MKRSMHWSCTSLMIMILFSHCQGHRLSSGSVAGAKVFERDNRGNFLYNVADEGIAGIIKSTNTKQCYFRSCAGFRKTE